MSQSATLTLTAVLGAALALAPPAGAQSIRMATNWTGPHFDVMAKGFAEHVALLTGGKVKVEVFPAGVVGSPLKVTETVQQKIAQAGHHWSGYDGIDKTAVLFGGYAGSMPAEHYIHWLNEGGGIDLWREWRLEKFNLVAMPCGSHADETCTRTSRCARSRT